MKVWPTFALFCLLLILPACSRQVEAFGEGNLIATAAAEATQILREAQATALILDARRQATDLMAAPVGQTTVPLLTPGGAAILPVKTQESQGTPPAGVPEIPSPTTRGGTVELISVGIGGEGLFIQVYFLAPPAIVGSWYQGVVNVTDEASGTVYNEIPVLPVVGPLFGKPVEEGQVGYVMLVNAPVPLQAGATVTVTLGEYIFEHIQVK
jgi:hypothetical protein